jgi:hypothetical protein
LFCEFTSEEVFAFWVSKHDLADTYMLLCRTNRCFNRLGWLEESSNYLVAPVGIILWAFINLPQEGRMHLEMLLWNLEEIEVFCGMG